MKIYLISALSVIFCSLSSFAQNSGESTLRQNGLTTTTAERGWLPSVAFTYGHFDQTGDMDQNGDSPGVRLTLTDYFPNSNWLGDASAGVQKLFLQNLHEATIGVLATSVRYEMARTWSAGPALDVFLSNGDDFGSRSNQAAFLGLTGYKEILQRDDQLVRIGLKYQSEILTTHQNSTFIGLTAEWAVGARSSMLR